MPGRGHITVIEEGSEKGLNVGSQEKANSLASETRRLSSLWQKRLGLPGFIEPITSRVQGSKVYLQAHAVSGTVSIGQFDVSIVPKYLEGEVGRRWETALTRMLACSRGSHYALSEAISVKKGERGFVDLVARAYADALSSALEKGIPQSYQRHEEWLSTARGRLQTEKMYPEVLYKPQKVPCEYEQYTVDTPATQLLKWAALRFGDFSIGNKTANRLQRLASEMHAVSATRPESSLEIDRLSLSPQYSHCLPALRLARWLAKGDSAVPGGGSTTLPGFLLHSDRVFESFVDTVMKAASRKQGVNYRKKRETLSKSHGGIPTTPDGQILEDSSAIAVVDVKYKEWAHHPKASDVYQVMAGARVLECEHAILIYPHQSDRVPPKQWSLEGEGYPPVVSTLFIAPTEMTNPGGFPRLVEKTAEDLSTILG
jgi:5-methylcytosine-specific restriction enzyme subunit McrC